MKNGTFISKHSKTEYRKMPFISPVWAYIIPYGVFGWADKRGGGPTPGGWGVISVVIFFNQKRF